MFVACQSSVLVTYSLSSTDASEISFYSFNLLWHLILNEARLSATNKETRLMEEVQVLENYSPIRFDYTEYICARIYLYVSMHYQN